MGNLQSSLEFLDLAADDAFLPDRQHPFEVLRTGMEEHQVHLTRPVAALDLVGKARYAGRLVGIHPDRDRCNGTGDRLDDLGGEAAIDQAGGQVPQEIHHMGPGHFADRLRQPWPDTGQAVDGGEQGKQNFGAHDQLSRES